MGPLTVAELWPLVFAKASWLSSVFSVSLVFCALVQYIHNTFWDATLRISVCSATLRPVTVWSVYSSICVFFFFH